MLLESFGFYLVRLRTNQIICLSSLLFYLTIGKFEMSSNKLEAIRYHDGKLHILNQVRKEDEKAVFERGKGVTVRLFSSQLSRLTCDC